MNKLLRIAAAAAVSASLVTGLAAAESGGSISNTGPDSTNKIINKNSDRLSVHNDNDVNVRNSNDQNATTGEAEVEDNTTGGDATSGNASNSNSLDASVTVDNSAGLANLSFGGSGSSGGSIDTTGPDSNNVIVNKSSTSVRINNDNDINICNTNTQNATSGEASVEHNTTGGSATSGDATNTNSSTFSVSVTN
jgi:hypothetical protein